MPDLSIRLPAEPLKRAIKHARRCREMSWDEFAEDLGLTARTLLRVMAAKDLSIGIGDRLAIRLGLHPVLLWPNEWQKLPQSSHKEHLKEVV